MKRETGGPAFPRVGYMPNLEGVAREDFNPTLALRTEPQQGMTLMDYYVGQALAGLLANESIARKMVSMEVSERRPREDVLLWFGDTVFAYAEAAFLARARNLDDREIADIMEPK